MLSPEEIKHEQKAPGLCPCFDKDAPLGRPCSLCRPEPGAGMATAQAFCGFLGVLGEALEVEAEARRKREGTEE